MKLIIVAGTTQGNTVSNIASICAKVKWSGVKGGPWSVGSLKKGTTKYEHICAAKSS